MLSPMEKKTLTTQVAKKIKQEILRGNIAPGEPLLEIGLAKSLNVSRGPLREALRLLSEEGLVTTVPYKGAFVTKLTLDDIQEIYSFRTKIEIFAYELIWERRDKAFRDELVHRHEKLLEAIDSNDQNASIEQELHLHSLVYEVAGHKILYKTWMALHGRLQIYWSAHHLAHGRTGPRRESHALYVETALGDSLEAMRNKIITHMNYGAIRTAQFLAEQDEPDSA